MHRSVVTTKSVVRHRMAVINWLTATFQTQQLVSRKAADLGASLPGQVATGDIVSRNYPNLDWGSGGARNPAQLKCLHAHVAFALAQPGYRIGELVLAEIPAPFPAGSCCSAPEPVAG